MLNLIFLNRLLQFTAGKKNNQYLPCFVFMLFSIFLIYCILQNLLKASSRETPPTSEVPHPTSEVKCLTSEPQARSSELKAPTLEPKRSTSEVKYPALEAIFLSAEVKWKGLKVKTKALEVS